MNTSKRIHFSFLGILFLGASIFGAYWTVIWILRDSYAIAFVALGTSLCCFDIGFQMVIATYCTVRPRISYGPKGTIIRPPKIVDLVFYVGTVGGISAAASYLTLKILDKTSDISWIIQRAAPPIAIIALVSGGWALYGIFRYGGESSLRLSPTGIEVWNGHWVVSAHKNWDVVEQISDHLPRNTRIRREMIVFALPKGSNAMLISDTMTSNSDALRAWTRFYWRHPEHRDELIDGRAIRRLEDEKFTG